MKNIYELSQLRELLILHCHNAGMTVSQIRCFLDCTIDQIKEQQKVAQIKLNEGLYDSKFGEILNIDTNESHEGWI